MAPWRCCAILALVALATAKVYETDDAVVIDLEPEQSSRPVRSVSSNELVPQARQFGGSWPPVLPVGPCFTSQGHLGRCTSFRQCYPYFKLPELSNWETWILGMYDTCSYFNTNGRQAFGVCCTNPSFPTATQRPGQPPRPTPPAPAPPAPPTTIPIAPVEQERPNPNPSQGAIPPNWPPPLPTHPPNHTIPPLPTHPPSPGWPGLPQPAPTQPAYPPPAPPTQAPTRPPPRPPTQPVYPAWPPTQAPVRPPAPTQPPTAAAPGPVLSDASCGARSGNFEDEDQERIVGGHDADRGEWPWIAALFNGGRQFCGGSLIDSTHILSAAHCIAHMTSWDVSRLTVRLGDHNIKSNTETQHVEKKVKRLVRHRGFDSRTLYNDIAILTLDSPVSFTKAIRPICLPSGAGSYEGKDATVVGWGSLRESGPQPAVLQEVTIPIWTNSECRTKYGNAAPGGIVEHFVCAGRAGRDSCSGDSGGPLMVNEGRWTQVGVVSWGIGCGKGQYPGVYTRVTHFLPWIKKNLS